MSAFGLRLPRDSSGSAHGLANDPNNKDKFDRELVGQAALLQWVLVV